MATKTKRRTGAVSRAKSKVQKVKSRVEAKAKAVSRPGTKRKRPAKTPGILERLKKLVTE